MWRPRALAEPWTPDQAAVARHFPARRRLVVPAANGVGKTFLAADLVVSFLLDHPGPPPAAARVLTTAPTNRQVQQLLWPQINRRLEALGQPTHRNHWNHPDGRLAVGFATDRPERLQGVHADKLLVIIDEASGMQGDLLGAIEGIAVGDDNYVLAIGNPNEAPGPMWDLTQQPSWTVHELSALTHPNIVHHREVIPGATTWPALCDRLRDWCRESDQPTGETFTLEVSAHDLGHGPDTVRSRRYWLPNDEFRVRYLGKFPLASSSTLFPPELVRANMDRALPDTEPANAALDVARTGGDRTVYALRRGRTVTAIRIVPATDLIRQADYVAALLLTDRPASITVDAAGLGIGLIDRLRTCTAIPLVAFIGSDTPESPTEAKAYRNRRTAAYAHLATAMRDSAISIPADPDLESELASLTYRYDQDGRMALAPKSEVRAACGVSPDKADAVSMLWALADPGWAPQPPPRSTEQAIDW